MKLYTVALFAISISIPNAAMSEGCECPGKQIVEYKGAPNIAIGWNFKAFLVEEGRPNSKPLICYRRSVTNNTDATALNIRWDVASFRRRIIPSKYIHDSCATLSGELSAAPLSGPLYYGISSDSHDTTVHPPREGWVQNAASSPAPGFPPVRSVFELGLNDAGLESTIIVYSYVQFERQSARLIYEIENRSSEPVNFLLNLPISGSMVKLPFLNSVFLKSNSRTLFEANVDSPVAVQSAVVVIFDNQKDNKKGFATDIVGVYAPIDGKRQFLDETLLDIVR
jgi:hypothetical protein